MVVRWQPSFLVFCWVWQSLKQKRLACASFGSNLQIGVHEEAGRMKRDRGGGGGGTPVK